VSARAVFYAVRGRSAEPQVEQTFCGRIATSFFWCYAYNHYFILLRDGKKYGQVLSFNVVRESSALRVIALVNVCR
jgi:hypothetical protein